jgi:hypothetical protein
MGGQLSIFKDRAFLPPAQEAEQQKEGGSQAHDQHEDPLNSFHSSTSSEPEIDEGVEAAAGEGQHGQRQDPQQRNNQMLAIHII